MPVHTIKPLQARVLAQMLQADDATQQVPQDAARETLLEIAHSLRTTSGGVKPGYLRLTWSEDRGAEFSLKRVSHNDSNDEFNEFARRMIARAYPDHHEQAVAAIDTYLSDRSSEKFGSQSFIKLIAHLEARQYGDDRPAREGSQKAKSQALSTQVRELRLKQDGRFSRAPRIDVSALEVDLLAGPHPPAEAQSDATGDNEFEEEVKSQVGGSQQQDEFEVQVVDENEIEVRPETVVSSEVEIIQVHGADSEPKSQLPLLKQLGLPASEIQALEAAGFRYGRELGAGGMGVAYTMARDDGQRFVYKRIKSDMRGEMPLTLDRQLEKSGGYLTYLKSPSSNVPGYHQQSVIVAPTHLLVSPGKGQPAQVMSVQDVRSALKEHELAPHQRTKWTLMGEISALAPGEDLYQEGRRFAYPERDQKAIFGQLLEMAVANRQRGIVHRDLKGENVKFDSETQKIAVFDWDLAYKVSKKKANPSELPVILLGSFKYMHPSTLGNKPCGFEADAHAIAMISLENRYPNLMPSLQDAMAFKCMALQQLRILFKSRQNLEADKGLPSSFSVFNEKRVSGDNYLEELKRLVLDLAQHAPKAIQAASSRGRINEAQEWTLRLNDARRFIAEAGWGPQGQAQAHPLVAAALGLMEDAHRPAATWLDKNGSVQMLRDRLATVQAHKV